MCRWLACLALGVAMVAGVGGCKHDNDDAMKKDSATLKDDCPHCPGVQTATADGKCPVCGMKVKG